MSEKEIIAGCCRNERQAQEMLYRKYFPVMMAMCLHHVNGDKDKAMEICNNGFLKVFQNIASYEFRGSFEGWIRRIVYHSAIDYHKANAKHVHYLVFEERDEAVQDNGLQNCYVEDIMNLVDLLPATTQQVFKLYALEGYSHKEIGVALNMSDGTSKWHLSTARVKLKKLLNEQYFYKNA
ncbi:MAG: RNA polymerase sigma factor [Saprospiraceae bacterium]